MQMLESCRNLESSEHPNKLQGHRCSEKTQILGRRWTFVKTKSQNRSELDTGEQCKLLCEYCSVVQDTMGFIMGSLCIEGHLGQTQSVTSEVKGKRETWFSRCRNKCLQKEATSLAGLGAQPVSEGLGHLGGSGTPCQQGNQWRNWLFFCEVLRRSWVSGMPHIHGFAVLRSLTLSPFPKECGCGWLGSGLP